MSKIMSAKGAAAPFAGRPKAAPHDFAVHFYELLLLLPCLHLEPNLTFIPPLSFHLLLDSTAISAIKHFSAYSND